jgi:hypothetical protein
MHGEVFSMRRLRDVDKAICPMMDRSVASCTGSERCVTSMVTPLRIDFEVVTNQDSLQTRPQSAMALQILSFGSHLLLDLIEFSA